MELLLNLCWLTVVATGCYFGSRRGPQKLFGPHFFALVCLAAILFPTISATDDIRLIQRELEDSGESDFVKSGHQTPSDRQFGHSDQLYVPLFAFVPFLNREGPIIALTVPLFQFIQSRAEFGRGPPHSLSSKCPSNAGLSH